MYKDILAIYWIESLRNTAFEAVFYHSKGKQGRPFNSIALVRVHSGMMFNFQFFIIEKSMSNGANVSRIC